MLTVVSGAAVLALAAVAWRQTSYWRNAETLWTHTLACTEQNALAHYNRAISTSSREELRKRSPISAKRWRSGSIDPYVIAEAHGLLAECLTIRKGKPTRRSRITNKQCVSSQPARGVIFAWRWRSTPPASTIEPSPSCARPFGWPPPRWKHVSAWPMLCWPAEMLVKRLTECREILKQEPGAIEAIVILGAALAAAGQVEEALPHLKRALELDPRQRPAHFHLGLALYDRGQSTKCHRASQRGNSPSAR